MPLFWWMHLWPPQPGPGAGAPWTRPKLPIDILGALVLSECYISHYAPGVFGHCSTCRLFNCHNTRSIAEYMLNYARQTLKRVPSFQELLQGKMGSNKEEMSVHRLSTCHPARLGLTIAQQRRRTRHRCWTYRSGSSKAPSPDCMLEETTLVVGQLLMSFRMVPHG